MMLFPRTRALLWCAALAACGEPLRVQQPTFSIVNPEVWMGASALRLVSPDLVGRDSSDIRVVLSGLDTSRALYRRLSQDTLLLVTRFPQGTTEIALEIAGVRSLPQPIAVLGVVDWNARAGFVTGPLPVGGGSSLVWVGTAAGLGLVDLRYPSLPAQLVDSTVDMSCLSGSIGRSGSAGIIVADSGCGALRARAYGGAARLELDSGPPAAGWRYAAHYASGIWLLADWNRVVLAVRSGGAWALSEWRSSAAELVPAPDSRMVAAVDGYQGGVLVFDMAAGTLLYHLAAGLFPGAVFVPTGDTLLVAADSTFTFVAAATGTQLGSVTVRPSSWGRYSGSRIVLDPYRPWLIELGNGNYGCPGYQVVDRRRWTFESVWASGDCAADGYVMVFSPSEARAWIADGQGDIATLTIPTPRP